MTNGEGKVSVGVSFTSVSYDRLDDAEFDGLQMRSVDGRDRRRKRVPGISNVDTDRENHRRRHAGWA